MLFGLSGSDDGRATENSRFFLEPCTRAALDELDPQHNERETRDGCKAAATQPSKRRPLKWPIRVEEGKVLLRV